MFYRLLLFIPLVVSALLYSEQVYTIYPKDAKYTVTKNLDFYQQKSQVCLSLGSRLIGTKIISGSIMP